ncbi:MAG TPA: FAD-dependent oxidoreductase, partial [Syntrophales bacterium]|nr:FAD-dependent oxidoreductase [Syntrophales bacterium]HQG83520.1 FAD-dependent oxidoreductase [Syntrophales bacterium]HQK48145.1 FAD-dependent oxidoreductase [Syntrophales bacterium]
MQKKADQKKTVLVVGGGVAGISAALDLAGNGHRVHLVERGHDLGG